MIGHLYNLLYSTSACSQLPFLLGCVCVCVCGYLIDLERLFNMFWNIYNSLKKLYFFPVLYNKPRNGPTTDTSIESKATENLYPGYLFPRRWSLVVTHEFVYLPASCKIGLGWVRRETFHPHSETPWALALEALPTLKHWVSTPWGPFALSDTWHIAPGIMHLSILMEIAIIFNVVH